MMIHTTRAPRANPAPSEVVVEVPPEDQENYARHSYHDLMHAWNALVRDLANARRTGDARTAARLTEGLRHFWPPANAVAGVAWVPDEDREFALPSDRAR